LVTHSYVKPYVKPQGTLKIGGAQAEGKDQADV